MARSALFHWCNEGDRSPPLHQLHWRPQKSFYFVIFLHESWAWKVLFRSKDSGFTSLLYALLLQDGKSCSFSRGILADLVYFLFLWLFDFKTDYREKGLPAWFCTHDWGVSDLVLDLFIKKTWPVVLDSALTVLCLAFSRKQRHRHHVDQPGSACPSPLPTCYFCTWLEEAKTAGFLPAVKAFLKFLIQAPDG